MTPSVRPATVSGKCVIEREALASVLALALALAASFVGGARNYFVNKGGITNTNTHKHTHTRADNTNAGEREMAKGKKRKAAKYASSVCR